MPRKSATTRQKLPAIRSDRRAEAFVRDADLSRYDLTALQPTRFEFAPKSARLNMRLPEDLLTAVKGAAADRGMPYQRFIRQALERALSSGRER
jgi:predicted DNA binding CopG/RHH family protein